MTKIVDLRGDSRILGPSNPNRSVAGITKIARHHSATATGDVWSFQNHWRGMLGWGTGGYHEIILRDGSVQLIYRDNVTTNGVGNHNSKTYHICVVGNGSFTAAQEKAFDERARAAMQRFNLKAADVLGHNEFSGHVSNSCPGINMKTVRDRLQGNNTVSDESSTTPQPTPSPTPAPTQPKTLIVDGSLGPLTARRWQEVTKMQIQDGRISHQWRQEQNRNIHAAIFDATLKGSNLIRDTQRRLGIKQDGLCGSQTITAMQRAKGTTPDGFISAPQSQLVMAIQRDLNSGSLPF